MTDSTAPYPARPASYVDPARPPRRRWRLVRGVWKLLVAIKDALVLIAMLLFFGLLFAALNARAGTKAIKDGALVLELNGSEERRVGKECVNPCRSRWSPYH